nr:MAG TPA: hypothetical protein [Crassvirales sp.]
MISSGRGWGGSSPPRDAVYNVVASVTVTP